MELKEYQKKTLLQVKTYLEWLERAKGEAGKRGKSQNSEFGEEAFDFPKAAWKKVTDSPYYSKKNGLGEDLPNFYLKLPTGGGKTLLACHGIDLINRVYLKKQNGIILWIVPTTQIYRQTLGHLRDREHPYRRVLDISSGGRTVILEKMDRFTKLDVDENLLIMLLMLPSANRQNKEVLKVFKDNGGFNEFFPLEDDRNANEKLLETFPNLDFFGNKDEIFGRIAKTSLGNTLRILRPAIIIDEGHKTYSDGAQKTIRDFNPVIIMELSATPPENANILVNISGQELNREEMIKLDLHILNKAGLDWKNTMLAAVEKRNSLEKKAKDYEANTNEYIRPICLVQVERTGKDQRGSRFIHSEDVKEYLMKQCGIPEAEIAIKSSEKDDIEGIDLFGRECRVRYIITKQALQEGWDCSFAYILTVLTNPSSQLSITQLVGRVLRQPKGVKTKVKELDESYVFCFRQKANELLQSIEKAFKDEGMGDLLTRVMIDEGDETAVALTKERKVSYRTQFKRFENKIYLPKFVMQEGEGWRDINYDMDILGKINWLKVNLSPLENIVLGNTQDSEQEVIIGLGNDSSHLIKDKGGIKYKAGGLEIDFVFVTRQVLDIIPNPWIAFNIVEKALKGFLKRYDKGKVVNNLVFMIEELRKLLEKERDQLAEQIFRDLMQQKKLCFFLLVGKSGYKLPNVLYVKKTSKALIRDDHTLLQRSLFDFVPEEDFNHMERSVALCLDEQEKLLWWYRNLSRQDYYIQGWKKYRIYPDFIFTQADKKKQHDYSKVFVIETKGLHLKNEDTDYKKNIFEFCNTIGKKKDWQELNLEFAERKFEFQVISEEKWETKINEISGEA